jgi:valyl-tRNA synthetase
MAEKQNDLPAIPEAFLKPYDPAGNEAQMYDLWEKSGYFNPDNLPGERAEPYAIVLPPPNVTGTLHMGHASMLAIEDVFVRFERMRGKKTLWLPGTDSAAIATQSKVEKIIAGEGTNRKEMGREAFLARVNAFALESQNTILGQTRAMGSSLDWSRLAYTLDDTRYKAVMEAFVRMYDAGLIYQGDRIVNWDPKGQTVISDDEIVYKEEKTRFYYFQYGPFVIGTARPETKFGDKYVVMHPDDERYKDYVHGQKLELEWINGPITATVIKDTAIDMEFGTGVMTITPWHSQIDFEIAERHGLDKEQIIDQYGKLLPIAGEFAGQKIAAARPAIVAKLREKGLLVNEEDYVHNIATAERTEGLVEPQIMRQWFVAVNKEFTIPHSDIPGIASGSTTTLKEIMRKAVESGAVTIFPENHARVYFHWIDNLRDWCISRQIWFGHRIPAWSKGGDLKVQIESPGEGWEQDPDTLDTWFSSGLWTFSTLGWPAETADLKTFHPTAMLETGYDILFFWVARMILMSGFHLGTVPFRFVYLHGLVRDGQGRKMSKSLGNIIDPLDMIAKYGADATRLSLLIQNTTGTDLKLSEDRVRGYKHFANKLWNITRFVLTSSADFDFNADTPLSSPDEALWSEFSDVIASVTDHFERHRIDLASDQLYHYAWHRFADEILEESKPVMSGTDAALKGSRQLLLLRILRDLLKLLHPFMPFVTETIWQQLPKQLKDASILMVATWPQSP